jgi:hypothetical protein
MAAPRHLVHHRSAAMRPLPPPSALTRTLGLMKAALDHLRRWVVAYVIATGVVVYAAVRAMEVQFWDGAVGNLLATLLGVIVGVPVALHLERRRQEHETAVSATAASRSTKTVVELLLKELQAVEGQMHFRIDGAESVPIEPLKVSTWETMRQSGHLSQISDARMLDLVSTAYHHIEVLRSLERATVGAIYGVNVIFQDGKNASTKLHEHSQRTYAAVTYAVQQAIDTLSSALAQE